MARISQISYEINGIWPTSTDQREAGQIQDDLDQVQIVFDWFHRNLGIGFDKSVKLRQHSSRTRARLARNQQGLLNFIHSSTEFDQLWNLAKLDQSRTDLVDVGQLWQSSTNIGPNPANSRRVSAVFDETSFDVGQAWADSGQWWSRLVGLGLARLTSSLGPSSTRHGLVLPMSAKVGLISVDVEPTWLDQSRNPGIERKIGPEG